MKLSTLTASALAASSALAQVSVDVSALTPVAVAAVVGAAPPSFVGIAPGPLTLPVSLQTAGGIVNGASVSITPSATGGPVGFVATARALFVVAGGGQLRVGGTSPSPSATGAAFGPVEVLARFLAPPGTTGSVRVALTRTATPAGTSPPIAAGVIDVGNDGTAEVTGPTGDTRVPATIGASGALAVRVGLEALVATTGNGAAVVTVRVDFLPDAVTTCTITAYGAGCNGATSSGSALDLGTIRAVTLLSAGGFANGLVLSAFGSQNIGPALPGGCALLTDAALVVPLASDAVGAAVHAFTIPTTAVGTLYHQFVPLDLAAFVFRASNGLEIACVP